MTKNHFEAVAEIIRGHIDTNFTHGVHLVQRDLINDLADYFKKENPKFDKKKFIKACGY